MPPPAGSGRFAGFLLLALLLPTAAASDALPRFTEEREAAALHFVRKHCPELTPLLEELKKSNRGAYELQVRETYQVTEYLSDLHDPARFDLELRIWKAENKALVMVAKLAVAREEDRKGIEEQLRTVAKELVDLDVRESEHRVKVLEQELATARDDLAKAKDGAGKAAQAKFDGLLEKAKKKRGT